MIEISQDIVEYILLFLPISSTHTVSRMFLDAERNIKSNRKPEHLSILECVENNELGLFKNKLKSSYSSNMAWRDSIVSLERYDMISYVINDENTIPIDHICLMKDIGRRGSPSIVKYVLRKHPSSCYYVISGIKSSRRRGLRSLGIYPYIVYYITRLKMGNNMASFIDSI